PTELHSPGLYFISVVALNPYSPSGTQTSLRSHPKRLPVWALVACSFSACLLSLLTYLISTSDTQA
ncbi:hypothetical protein, partial [Roseiconus lacunae]